MVEVKYSVETAEGKAGARAVAGAHSMKSVEPPDMDDTSPKADEQPESFFKTITHFKVRT